MKRPDYARVTSRSFKPRHWLLTRLHDTWPARRLVRRLLKLCKSYYNSDGHIMRNGEDWLLGQLMEHYRAQSISPVAFDVGANNGFWTWRLLSRDPALQVHCFEPVPETFGELAGNFKDEACVHLHDFGLSDCSETVEFWRNRKPGAASRYRDRKSDGGKYADVELRRGDGFLEDMEIDKLHILKVDAEGMDYQVLLGLGPISSRAPST